MPRIEETNSIEKAGKKAVYKYKLSVSVSSLETITTKRIVISSFFVCFFLHYIGEKEG